MTIGPEDIERVVFKERFRGYDQDQVDRFLDEAAAALAALRAERDELAARVAGQGGAHAGAPAPAQAGEQVDALISRTLSAAQRTAEELLADARARAADIMEDAHGRAAAARRQTQLEAELVRRAVGDLRAFREEYRSRLHAIMSEQLAALDRAGELPRLPATVDQALEHAARDVPAEPLAPRREPSPAQAWAAAAAQDPEEAAEDAAGLDGADELASPWDDLWRGEAGEADVQEVPGAGTHERAGDHFEVTGRDGAPAEHAGDA